MNLRTRRETILPLSVTFLCISVLMHRVAGGSKWLSFFEGVFMGMSFALAVFALIMGALAKSHE